MVSLGREYDGFAFISDNDPNDALIKNSKKKVGVEELIGKKLVIFVSHKILRKLEREYEDVWEEEKKKDEDKRTISFFNNQDGEVLNIRFGDTVFKSFSLLTGYTDAFELRDDFAPYVKGKTDAEIMQSYVYDFLIGKIGLMERHIHQSNQSGISERTFYKRVGEPLFDRWNYNLPKEERERRIVYNHFKQNLIDENGKVYGVLECKPGYYQNVAKIDLGNYYGYQMCVGKFLKGNPYDVLMGKSPEFYDYLPMSIRKAALDNYKIANEKDKDGNYIHPRGVRAFYKGCNNHTIGRCGNLAIYLKRSNKIKQSWLGPQHNFEIIRRGIEQFKNYNSVFEQLGGEAIMKDTDGAGIIGFTKEQARGILDVINQQVVQSLLNAGFSEEDANCGIGQWKLEHYCDEYYQFGDKGYCFREGDKITITYAGITKKEKEEILRTSNSFMDVVEKLKAKKINGNKVLSIPTADDKTIIIYKED